MYTHDITEHTGGEIVIMPEAHKAGILPVGKPHEDIEGQLVFRPKKGTVIFLHGHCFHRVMPVKSDRISTNFRAVPKGTPEDITDICVYRNMMYKFSTSEVLVERSWSQMPNRINIKKFGVANGTDIQLISLRNEQGTEFQCLDFGATWHALKIKGKNKKIDVLLSKTLIV